MPRGLFGRSLLIIVTPVVILQGIVTYVFFERHYDIMTARMARGVSYDVSFLVNIEESARPAAEREALLDMAAKTLGYQIELMPGARLAEPYRHTPARPEGRDEPRLRRPARRHAAVHLAPHRRRQLHRPQGGGEGRHPARAHPAEAAGGVQRPTSSSSGWWARRWCCWRSPSCSCATRCGRSNVSPSPPRTSARAAWCATSSPMAPPRCARRRRPSSPCASASSGT